MPTSILLGKTYQPINGLRGTRVATEIFVRACAGVFNGAHPFASLPARSPLVQKIES
jgi:hypothetical protein